MKTIIILGSTGSIGTNTLDFVQRFPGEFRVAGLTAGNNIDKLEEQIRAFAASRGGVAVKPPATLRELAGPLGDSVR
jgi:1-deoxy-D-xylulose-5-phosphate reductoisomerase